MKYDFDKIIERRGTDSIKWKIGENELPMWVADMDFEAAPEITADFMERVKYGVFGYAYVTDEWYDAYISWWEKRHNLRIEKEWLLYCSGIVPAISNIIRSITKPGENILMLSPIYNAFFHVAASNERNALECPLIYADNEYTIDYEALEEHMKDNNTTLFIWCNPHNPGGKIWDAETMEKIGDMCKRHGVTVISDEIHCDICRPGMSYIPFATVSDTCREISITCLAPTKTFNIAGIKSSALCVPNEELRKIVKQGLETDEVEYPNSLSALAAISAFNKGEAWLEEMREYVFINRNYVEEFIKTSIPRLHVVKGDATYLLWIDISEVFDDGDDAYSYIRKKTGLFISAGNMFGEAGKGFIRMNVACPLELVKDGINRLKEAVELKTGEKLGVQ